MNFGFIIDNRKCIGCHACTVACKSEHDVPIGVNRTWVKYIEKGEFPNTTRHFSVMRCNHCADAPCVEICPVSALFTRSDGIVDFDNRRCIGCKACMQACPYDALYLDPETSTAAKCNYCAHRIDIGLEPACVNVCPEHAIISGDLDDPGSEIAQLLAREQVTVRKEEKGTAPKLFYIDGDRASLTPTASNPSDSYFWSSQSAGVGHYARFAQDRLTLKGGDAGTEAGGRGRQDPAPADVKDEGARRVYDAPAKGVLWGWEVTAYVWTKAIACGAFLSLWIATWQTGRQAPRPLELGAFAIALVFLIATGILLVKDLDRPSRFLYVLLRPQWRSWLTRGAFLITGFALSLSLWGFAAWAGWPQSPALEAATAFLAAAAALYTAFLLAQAKGRDFWQSPMLPLHMIVHALMAGCSALLLASFLLEGSSDLWTAALSRTLAVAILVHLATVAIELSTPHATQDSVLTARRILRGRQAPVFWLGMILAGNLLPLAAILLVGAPMAIAIASALTLSGLWAAEHLWVRTPQTIPLS